MMMMMMMMINLDKDSLDIINDDACLNWLSLLFTNMDSNNDNNNDNNTNECCVLCQGKLGQLFKVMIQMITFISIVQ